MHTARESALALSQSILNELAELEGADDKTGAHKHTPASATYHHASPQVQHNDNGYSVGRSSGTVHSEPQPYHQRAPSHDGDPISHNHRVQQLLLASRSDNSVRRSNSGGEAQRHHHPVPTSAESRGETLDLRKALLTSTGSAEQLQLQLHVERQRVAMQEHTAQQKDAEMIELHRKLGEQHSLILNEKKKYSDMERAHQDKVTRLHGELEKTTLLLRRAVEDCRKEKEQNEAFLLQIRASSDLTIKLKEENAELAAICRRKSAEYTRLKDFMKGPMQAFVDNAARFQGQWLIASGDDEEEEEEESERRGAKKDRRAEAKAAVATRPRKAGVHIGGIESNASSSSSHMHLTNFDESLNLGMGNDSISSSSLSSTPPSHRLAAPSRMHQHHHNSSFKPDVKEKKSSKAVGSSVGHARSLLDPALNRDLLSSKELEKRVAELLEKGRSL